VVFRVGGMPSFRNNPEFTSFSLAALKIDLVKNGSFLLPFSNVGPMAARQQIKKIYLLCLHA